METNKILGAIILALLLAAVFSKVADMAIHPEYPEELAYQIDIPEVNSSGAQAEEVDIFAVLPEITPFLHQQIWEMVKNFLRSVHHVIPTIKVVKIKLDRQCGVLSIEQKLLQRVLLIRVH